MRIPLLAAHPERTCWGCDKYCPGDDLACGNGTIRTLHPVELFGPDWLEWFERPGKFSGERGNFPTADDSVRENKRSRD
jgi:hypothetical protein